MRAAVLLCAVLLALAGCAAEGDVGETAATSETGTVRVAAGEEEASSAVERYPEVPTRLELSEAEEQAAREALSKVDDFYDYAHAILRNGGEETAEGPEVASGGAEAELQETARDFRENGERLEHAPLMRDRRVNEVVLEPRAGASVPFVTVELCADASQARVAGSATPVPTAAAVGETTRHTATVGKFRVGWRVTGIDVAAAVC